MSVIRHIKSKIATIEAYLRSNNAMKSVASVRINKYKKKMKTLEEVKEIVDFDQYKSDSEFKKKSFHIIVGCNQGMCGTFFSYISHYVKSFVQENIDNDFICVLGEKFLEYSLHENISSYKLPLSDNLILHLVDEIINKALKDKTTDIFLHYYNKNKIVVEHIIKNRNPDSDYDVYRMLYFVNMITRAIYTSGFHENKERVLALEQAKTNAEKMQKKGYNELNRVRQESITNDLAEIVSGVLL